jgi:hypothetical protein
VKEVLDQLSSSFSVFWSKLQVLSPSDFPLRLWLPTCLSPEGKWSRNQQKWSHLRPQERSLARLRRTTIISFWTLPGPGCQQQLTYLDFVHIMNSSLCPALWITVDSVRVRTCPARNRRRKRGRRRARPRHPMTKSCNRSQLRHRRERSQMRLETI